MTKKISIFLISSLLAVAALSFLSGCRSAQTTSHGLEDAAYLQISGDTSRYKTSNGSVVSVILDEGTPFLANVNPSKKRAVKNKYTYKIAKGAHEVEILFDNQTVLKTNIFTSANQIKIIELP